MKGQKTGGRKAGTPNKSGADARALAQEHGPAVILRLAKIATKSRDERAAVVAGKALLDRAYGRVPQPLVGADEDGKTGPLRIVIQRFDEEKD